MGHFPKHIARITCVVLSCVVNLILLLLAIKKIYIQRQLQATLCLKLLISYLFLAFFTPFYNIIYRYLITPNDCFLSDTIEEGLVILARGTVSLFYIIRLKTIFHGSFGEISNRILTIVIIILILYSIIIPLLWIPQQQVTPHVTSNFGVYCSNTGDIKIIAAYYICDFIFTLSLTSLYVYRLRIISNSETLGKKALEVKKVIKKTIFFTAISIVSTWIIMYPSYLTATDFLSELRWFYPLDYGINGICLFSMFNWRWNGFCCNCNCIYCESRACCIRAVDDECKPECTPNISVSNT